MSSKKGEARERVKAMREEQAKKERRRERTLRFSIAAAVLAAVVIIAVAVNASRDGGAVNLPSDVSADDAGIVVGDPDAPVTIDNWIDFLCPHCQEFEETNGEAVDELVDSGDVKVVYHPLTFTGATYSARANSAFACAADEGQANEFLKAAFNTQIQSASPVQWSNDDLKQIGEDAGVGGDFAACVDDGTYESWTDTVDDAAREAEVTGTPTLFIDGPALDEPELMNERTPDGIRNAVEAAKG